LIGEFRYNGPLQAAAVGASHTIHASCRISSADGHTSRSSAVSVMERTPEVGEEFTIPSWPANELHMLRWVCCRQVEPAHEMRRDRGANRYVPRLAECPRTVSPRACRHPDAAHTSTRRLCRIGEAS
jgi:hypothetical protein